MLPVYQVSSKNVVTAKSPHSSWSAHSYIAQPKRPLRTIERIALPHSPE